MKKFIFYFICYIGCLISVFNEASAQNTLTATGSESPLILIHIDEDSHETTEETNSLEDANLVTTQTSSKKAKLPISTKPKNQDKLKKITVEVYKLFLTPFIINKLYPNEKIKEDITKTLKKLYPTASEETLSFLSMYAKSFLYLKRRYDYVVQTLEQKIKAAKLLPQDELIVAKDGEYAPEFSDATKQSGPDEYQIKYDPYKYIEYDVGELGEPVRRRDKNYQEKISETTLDEIVLAILKFDIPAFIKAVRSVPAATDNSQEKSFELDNGLKARLLMAQSKPGPNPTLQAVLEVYIPKDHYITGDYLNPHTKPKFFLREDKDADTNISNYTLFLPEANGIIKDGKAKRILIGTVRYPIEFTRRDTDKPATLKGSFVFEYCHKDGHCTPQKTDHEFTVRPSIDEEASIYYNYVTQGFTHLPSEKAKHAELSTAVYNASSNTLNLTFNTTRTYSQIAAMAEDAKGTNFTNPRYSISENKVTATFDISTEQGSAFSADEPIAITAMFNNQDNMRIVVTPSLEGTPESTISSLNTKEHTPLSKWLFFTYGLLLNIMPGIFYLFIRLTKLFWTRKDRLIIFIRYALGSALGLSCIAYFFEGKYFSQIYETPIFTTISLIIATSFLAECMGYIDFSHFRPFRGKLRRGFLIGFFSVILITSFPMLTSEKTLSPLFDMPASNAITYYAYIWLGLMVLPLITLIFPQNKPNFFNYMKELNIVYNLIYLIGCLSLIFILRGESAFWLTILTLALIFGLWYTYIIAINETLSHTKSKTKQQALFYKVQTHALLVLIVLAILNFLAISSFDIIRPTTKAPLPTEVMETQKKDPTPKLIAITAPWSINSNLNIPYLKKLENLGIKTTEIKVLGDKETVKTWFKTYDKFYAPLNILFTSRHPYGLKLPDNLSNLNWEEALNVFEQTENSIPNKDSPNNTADAKELSHD